MTSTPSLPAPGQLAQVFLSDDIYVSGGVNTGDGLGLPSEVLAGDAYALDAAARPQRLILTRPDDRADPQVAEGSQLGRPGDPIKLVARYTLMSPDGAMVELLVLTIGAAVAVLPLSPLSTALDYTLLRVDTEPEAARLSDVMCLSFARGTMITLATGRQTPIEHLRPGDPVLTRDHGAQALRHAGSATLRAVGAFAPVVITSGTLGNSGDLVVSQHHRMFLYQRRRLPGLATSELLVQARHLVDDEKVFLREGGVVEWFSLAFDRHEIIYAEGIPAESLMVNDATVSRLPEAIAAEVKAQFPGLAQVQHFGTEAGRQDLETLGATGQLFQPPPRRRGKG